MGWADCGTDSTGRPIGYAHSATCDHSGCTKEIDRGLSYACGDMHGQNEADCEGYFCEQHRVYESLTYGGKLVQLCIECGRRAKQVRLRELAEDLINEECNLSTDAAEEAGGDLLTLLNEHERFRDELLRLRNAFLGRRPGVFDTLFITNMIVGIELTLNGDDE
jgi:hypothetical protein